MCKCSFVKNLKISKQKNITFTAHFNIKVMKKARNKFYSVYNSIIIGLLGILGLTTSSCDKLRPDPVAEYGVPSAKFIVNGKVEARADNSAIENIRVIMRQDTTYTDSEGKYQLIDKYGSPMSQDIEIKFSDIDGANNGEFNNMDTVVEFKNPEFVNGDGKWYAGETSKEFNIELEKK